jgi:protein-S-isoprenylcysteine O-methyltransferase Ste14
VRIDPQFRWALYAAGAVLLITGAGWLLADAWKENADVWQDVAANLLMVHGGAAMVALMLLGALVPLHLRRAWRAKRNRLTGTAMATVNAILIITAFGLYYFGSDAVRPWTSRIHYGFGLALPLLGLVHVLWGRRTATETRERAAERVA